MKTVFLVILLFALNAAADTQKWDFEAELDGSEFGFHTFEVTRDGETIKVNSKTEYDYYIAFIRAFKYRHQAQETWEGRCVESVNSKTDNNGDDEYLRTLRADIKALELVSHDGKVTLNDCVGAYSYWDLELLKDRDNLLNPQNGKYLPIDFEAVGEGSVKYKGKEYPADKYQLKVDGDVITLWYEKKGGVWMKLRSELKNGKTLEYLPKEITMLDSVER